MTAPSQSSCEKATPVSRSRRKASKGTNPPANDDGVKLSRGLRSRKKEGRRLWRAVTNDEPTRVMFNLSSTI